MGPAQFAGDELMHPRQAVFRRRIGRQKLLGEAHGAKRQADGLADVFALGEGDLAASAAQVDEQHAARRPVPGLGSGAVKPHHA